VATVLTHLGWLVGRQLERYLNALAAHPVLRHSAELRAFLESEAGFATSPVLREQVCQPTAPLA
jgi:hypothetical protein